MGILDDAKTLNADFHNRYKTENIRQSSLSFERNDLVRMVLEQAIRQSGVYCNIMGEFSIEIDYEHRTRYPFRIANDMIDKRRSTLATGWERQADGAWFKQTDDFINQYMAQVIISPDVVKEEEATPDGILLPNDDAMNAFASEVGFTTPVKQK
ncbi:MAG: hypothetical protein J0M34_02680 [Alphaproteobacteria bacterium]|nr:hypothetical protein [Alphaproteobacteria bacterium]